MEYPSNLEGHILASQLDALTSTPMQDPHEDINSLFEVAINCLSRIIFEDKEFMFSASLRTRALHQMSSGELPC